MLKTNALVSSESWSSLVFSFQITPYVCSPLLQTHTHTNVCTSAPENIILYICLSESHGSSLAVSAPIQYYSRAHIHTRTHIHTHTQKHSHTHTDTDTAFCFTFGYMKITVKHATYLLNKNKKSSYLLQYIFIIIVLKKI